MLFFRYGEDDFPIQRDCRRQLTVLSLTTGATITYLNAAEIDSLTLLTALNNQSLFQQTKIIVLANPFSAKNQGVLEGLANLLANNNPTEQPTTWLLINESNIKLKYQSGKNQPVLLDLEGRAKPLTKIQQKVYALLAATPGQQQYYAKLNGVAAEELLDELIKESGSQLTASAKKLLLQLTNYNFWQISHELNKLTNYQSSIDQKQAIDDNLIHLLVNDTSSHLFEFIEAINDQKITVASRLLEEIFADETDLAISLALLNRQTLQFLQVKAQLESGQNPAIIEKSLGLPPSIGQKIIRQARGLKLDSLRLLVENLTKFDWASKRSRGNLATLFILLLISHTNQK
jgi:DNA polymerase III delta subunit